jgi:hypothetical protein
MANNKVQLANGTVLIDITDTTANASDVLSGEYFYDASGVKTEGSLTIPSTYTVTKTLTNVTTNNDDTEVLVGGSFYMDLIPISGYTIESITVTMGGIDVTEQVFKAGVGSKTITQNGKYDAEDDWLEGYSSVEVNVSGEGIPTGTKEINITENGTITENISSYENVEINTNVVTSYVVNKAGSGTNTIQLDIPFTPSKIIYYEIEPLSSGSFVSTTRRVAGVYDTDYTRGYYVPQGNTTRGGYMQLTTNQSYDTTTGVFTIGSSSVVLLASRTYRFIAIK